MAKSKLDLEKEKLQLEIDQLAKTIRVGTVQKWISIIQAFSVVIGIFFALNEFVFKDRKAANNKTKATLDFLKRISDSSFRNSEDSLLLYHDLVFVLPISTNRTDSLRRDSVFSSVANRFSKGTFDLCNFYNILENGIEQGYFDQKLSAAYLSYDVNKNIDILEELQATHNGIGNKTAMPIPDYKQFKGLIDFYLRVSDVPIAARKYLPQYDLGKPFFR